MIASGLASQYVPADGHGGPFPSGQPRIIVIHSIECPLGAGWASSLAVNWMQHSGLSVHYIVDPSQVVQCLSEDLIGYGAGTVNHSALHIEQSGYARYTREAWTTPDGIAQINRLGKLVADVAARHNIPVRWLTDAQLLAAFNGTGPGGLATHSDCTRVIGGTTHTDPGDGYPRDLLLAASLPPPPPLEADMPLNDDDKAWIKSAIIDVLRNETTYAVKWFDEAADGDDPKAPNWVSGSFEDAVTRGVRLTSGVATGHTFPSHLPK